MNFFKVGPGSYVNADLIERVDFKSDGSAVVHRSANNDTVVDKDHVAALKELVGAPPPAKAKEPKEPKA